MTDAKKNTKEDISAPFLVSIIIATCNAGKTLRACLESIRRYGGGDIEIVIVDCVSTDDTLSIAEEFGVTNLVSEKDKGIYDAMNKGTAWANGKWLYFLGADDSLLPGFTTMTEKLDDAHCIYYGNTNAVYLSDKKVDYHLLSGRFSNYRLAKYPVNHQAVIYPAAVFKTRSYDLKYKVFADYALNIELWGDKNFRVEYHPVTIASYNMTGFSAAVKDAVFKKDKERLIRKNLGFFVWLRYCLKRFKKRVKGEDWS